MSQISLNKLEKEFPGGVRAVDAIDLTIPEHEIICLLGPSGCGKTTTLRCIGGLEDPTGGEIWIGDDRVWSEGRSVPPERRDIGMIFQSYAIWPHMTVFGNVAFGLQLQKLPEDEIKRRVNEVLELVGLSHLPDRYATDLSGGQQQRVAVARSVVMEPRVLIFDEPLSNLDAKLREHMRFEIRRLQKALGTTAVYVTHDQAEAMAIADRIAIMNHGKIVQIGTPQDLYLRPANTFVADFIGMTNLLRAEVKQVASGSMMVREVTRGVSFEVPQVGGFSVGDSVEISVRPEAIEISTGDLNGESRSNTWQGVVKDVVFLGNSVELRAEIDGLELRVQTNSSARHSWAELERGATVHVPADQIIVVPESAEVDIDEDTTVRLGA